MELGDMGLRWIRLVPEFAGNRGLPPEEQLSLEIERVRTAEVMLSDGNDPEKLRAWRESEGMRVWRDHPEFGPLIAQYDTETLAVFRQFAARTRAFRGFIFDGQVVTDSVEVFLKSPPALTNEITTYINAASRLTGQVLGNFVSLCGGPPSVTDAPPAPEGADQRTADTPAATTGS